jgi:hypothetical protein
MGEMSLKNDIRGPRKSTRRHRKYKGWMDSATIQEQIPDISNLIKGIMS